MPREYGSLLFLPCRCIKQDQWWPRCKNDQDIYSHQPSVAMQTFTLPAILTGEASKARKSLEAIALRSELWRRYPMKTVFCWSDVTKNVCDKRFFSRYFRSTGCNKMYKVVLKTGFSMTFPMGFLHEQPWWCLVMPGRVAFGASLRGLVRHFTDANTGIAIWWQDLPPPEKGAVFLREKSSLPSIKIFRCYVSFREVLFHDIWIFGYIGLPATWKVWVEWMETWKIETACLL